MGDDPGSPRGPKVLRATYEGGRGDWKRRPRKVEARHQAAGLEHATVKCGGASRS